METPSAAKRSDQNDEDLPLPEEEPPAVIAIERQEGMPSEEEAEPPAMGVPTETLTAAPDWEGVGNGQSEGGEES